MAMYRLYRHQTQLSKHLCVFWMMLATKFSLCYVEVQANHSVAYDASIDPYTMNIWVCGQITVSQTTSDYNDFAGNVLPAVSTGTINQFVAKLTYTGEQLDFIPAGTDAACRCKSVWMDGDNVFVGGYLTGTTYISFDPTVTGTIANGQTDSFVAKLNKFGKQIYFKTSSSANGGFADINDSFTPLKYPLVAVAGGFSDSGTGEYITFDGSLITGAPTSIRYISIIMDNEFSSGLSLSSLIGPPPSTIIAQPNTWFDGTILGLNPSTIYYWDGSVLTDQWATDVDFVGFTNSTTQFYFTPMQPTRPPTNCE